VWVAPHSIEQPTEILPPIPPIPPTLPRDLDAPVTGPRHSSAPAADQPSATDAQRALAQLAWLLPTIVTAGLGLVRVGWPALWADELATWGMATVSWGRTWQVLQHTDATLGAYYGFMHVWVSALGDSDVLLRLPSVLAMAAAAGLTARIGTQLATPRVGLLSGLVFALLPTTSRYGQEARPYALVVFAAVLSTLVLLRWLDRPRGRTLAAYALATALLGLLHAIALLLVPAHALVVLAVRRPLVRRWLVAAGIGMVPALPVLYLGSQQTAQVSWIDTPSWSSLATLPVALLGTAVGAGMVLALAVSAVSTRHPAVIYTSWAVVPLVGLFLVSQLTALWLPRYLLFTTPALALLAGTALGRARLVRGLAGLAVLAAVCATAQVAIREPDGHLQGTREAAVLIAAQMRPGDAIVYSTSDTGAEVYGTSDRVGRDLVAHYIPADRRPADVLQTVPQRTAGRVTAVECTNVAACLRHRKRIWLQRLGHQSDPLQGLGGTKGSVLRNGYYVSAVWYPRGLTVALVLPKPTG
jgi:mannosyltransferase